MSGRAAGSRQSNLKARESRRAYALVLPGALALALIVVAVLRGFAYSLTNYSFVSPAGRFVGIQNYLTALTSSDFLSSLKTTAIIGSAATIAETVFGYVVARFLSYATRPRRFVQAILILPLMVPPVIAGVMWKVVMAEETGPLNYVIGRLGLPAPNWLSDPVWAPVSIVLIDFWSYLPFATLVCLAGLNALPQDVFEAAVVDGASFVQRELYLTIPMLRPFLGLVLAFRAMDTLQIFDVIYATTLGGPGDSTFTLPILIYQTGFSSGLFGYAMAMAFLMYGLIFIITRLSLRREKELP